MLHEQTKKRVYTTLWFHLYVILEEAKLISRSMVVWNQEAEITTKGH